MTVLFRPATREDRDAVEAVFAAAYPPAMAGLYPAEVLERALPLILSAQDALLTSGTFLVGHLGDRAVAAGGWTAWAPGTRRETPQLAHIRHVATDPDHAPRGTGRALVERLMAEARAAGFTRMEALSTLNAAPFYAHMGFEEIAPVDVGMGDGVVLPSIRMEASLA